MSPRAKRKAEPVAEPAKAQHGGARPGAGRPAGTGEHDAWLRIRASQELVDKVQARADRDGVTFAAWVRAALRKAAGK
jgi:hypothetical protein